MAGSYKKKTRRGGSLTKIEKPPAMCQCRDPVTGKGCTEHAVGNTVFCKEHQNCPGSPLNGHEPVYDPKKWNDKTSVYRSSNCYSYFANRIDPKMVNKCKDNNGKECRQFFPQPGALSGDRYALNATERRQCKTVDSLIHSDIPGLVKSTFYDKCPAGMSKGAMVVDEGNDYHFYRQDADGWWSHKDGSNKVKRFDALYKKIWDPELASRDYRWQGSDLNYEDFCAFYCVPRDQEVVLGQGGGTKKGGKFPGRTAAQEKEKVLGGSWTDHPAQGRAATRRRVAAARKTRRLLRK